MSKKICLSHMRAIMIRYALSERSLRRLMKRLDDEGRAELCLLFEGEPWERVVDIFCEHLATRKIKKK